MAETTTEARQELDNARRDAATELDRLSGSVRHALDIPGHFRRDPLRASALAGGAAFLLLGGPKRVLRAAEKRVLPRRRPRALLPNEIEQSLRHLPEEDREAARAHIERDFAAYLRREHPKEQPNARKSFWATYDVFLGILGAAAARELLKKFFSAEEEAEAEVAQKRAEGGLR
jgi:hypothetical protein